jgi:hypothetical protein
MDVIVGRWNENTHSSSFKMKLNLRQMIIVEKKKDRGDRTPPSRTTNTPCVLLLL